jgi:hypothetical protein
MRPALTIGLLLPAAAAAWGSAAQSQLPARRPEPAELWSVAWSRTCARATTLSFETRAEDEEKTITYCGAQFRAADGRYLASFWSTSHETFTLDDWLFQSAKRVPARVLAVSRGGTVMGKLDGAGLVRVFSLRTLETVGTLRLSDDQSRSFPAARCCSDGDGVALAVDDSGDLLAVATADAVRIYRRRGAGYDLASPPVALPLETSPRFRYATFSAAGTSLFVETITALHVVRPGPPGAAPPLPDYEAAAPRGFELGARRGKFSPPGQELFLLEDLPRGHLASYAHPRPRAHPDPGAAWGSVDGQVHVYVSEANEFGETKLGSWSRAVAARFLPAGHERLRAWRDEAGQRVISAFYLNEDGCPITPAEYFVIAERGPYLVHVRLETTPAISASVRAAWMRAFQQAPLRAPRALTLAAGPGRVLRTSPC